MSRDAENPIAVEEENRTYFRDVMENGPFDHWEHTHSFFVDDEGDEAETSGHDPSRQRATAMRPSVDETVARQRQVLEDLLDGRLDEDHGGSGEFVYDWVDRLDVATDGLLSILDSMTVESSFRELLTGDGVAHARGRELLAGRWLIPVSCLAIRRVAVGASEVPDAAPLDKEIPIA